METYPNESSGGIKPPNSDTTQVLLADNVSNLLNTMRIKGRAERLASLGGPAFAKKIQDCVKKLDAVSVGIQQEIGNNNGGSNQ